MAAAAPPTRYPLPPRRRRRHRRRCAAPAKSRCRAPGSPRALRAARRPRMDAGISTSARLPGARGLEHACVHGRHRRSGRLGQTRHAAAVPAAARRVSLGTVTNDTTGRRVPHGTALPGGVHPRVETSGCPHAAIREDCRRTSRRSRAHRRREPRRAAARRMGGDNLAANFSSELADFTVRDRRRRRRRGAAQGRAGIAGRPARDQQDRPRRRVGRPRRDGATRRNARRRPTVSPPSRRATASTRSRRASRRCTTASASTSTGPSTRGTRASDACPHGLDRAPPRAAAANVRVRGAAHRVRVIPERKTTFSMSGLSLSNSSMPNDLRRPLVLELTSSPSALITSILPRPMIAGMICSSAASTTSGSLDAPPPTGSTATTSPRSAKFSLSTRSTPFIVVDDDGRTRPRAAAAPSAASSTPTTATCRGRGRRTSSSTCRRSRR